MSTAIAYRDPILTLGSSDPVVVDLCTNLDLLGYDVGPLGNHDVSPLVMAAVNQFRKDHDIAEDVEGLGPEAKIEATIGTATWVGLREVIEVALAAKAEHDAAEAAAAEEADAVELPTVEEPQPRGALGRFVKRHSE